MSSIADQLRHIADAGNPANFRLSVHRCDVRPDHVLCVCLEFEDLCLVGESIGDPNAVWFGASCEAAVERWLLQRAEEAAAWVPCVWPMAGPGVDPMLMGGST